MDKLENFWDKVAKNYNKTEKRYDYIHVNIVEFTKKYLNSNDLVLDYGCGPGTKTCKLADYVNKIHAINISGQMISMAKSNALKQKIDNINFIKTTIFNDNFKLQSFDVILVFNILHALEDRQIIMTRLYELLKPAGIIICVSPCLREKMSFLTGTLFLFNKFLMKTGLVPFKVKQFNNHEFLELIQGAHFEIIETEKLFHELTSCFIAAKKVKKIATKITM